MHHFRIPLVHQENSPFRKRLKRRLQLKTQLGRARPLVSHARKWTKTRFLQEFYTPAEGETRRYEDGKLYHQQKLLPHITTAELVHRTGYTPEQFWREVHHPNTVKPAFLL